MKNNVFSGLPVNLQAEIFEDIQRSAHVRIERIISRGHSSPDKGWYDQDENEWVIVLQGAGELSFDDGSTVRLLPGDYLNIPARRRHRVSWTDPAQATIWLAVFYT